MPPRPELRVPDALLNAIQEWRAEHPMKQRVLAEAVLTLSGMFTGRTPMRPGYLSKPSLRAAYLAAFLPMNYLKVRRVLDELDAYAPGARTPALDFGCGPGTAALAIGHGRVDLYDIVDEAVEDALFLIRRAVPQLKAHRVREPEGRYRTIVASNVLSEMRDLRALERLLEESLEPDGHLVVIEPAMRETTLRLMEWRDALAKLGWRIAAPCLGQRACPMRTPGGEQWCHEDVAWNPPASVNAIDRRTGLRHETLKYSYLVVTRAGATLGDASPGGSRVVSDLHRAKGRAWMSLCGREGPLCTSQFLTRHRSDATRDFERARRGDILSVEPAPSGEMQRLPENARITRVPVARGSQAPPPAESGAPSPKPADATPPP